MFPKTALELAQIGIDAQIVGNYSPLLRAQTIRSLASLLHHLHTINPDCVPPLSGVKKDALALIVQPGWAQHTLFIEFSKYVKEGDTPDRFEKEKVKIPPVASNPGPLATDTNLVQAAIVHYQPTVDAGLILDNAGNVWINSVQSFRLHSSLIPTDVKASDNQTIPHFHVVFITLCANIHLYDEIITKQNLTISSTCNV